MISPFKSFKSMLWLPLVLLSACNSPPFAQAPTPVVDVPQASVPASPAAETTAEATPNPIFNPVLPELEQQTDVPVVLPAYIPTAEETEPVYAVVESATPSKYEVILGFTEDCNGGTACRLGTITAETATPETAPTGEKVALANGVTGYFNEATCGANCSDATLSWEQNGSRYTVGLKAGKEEALVEMANSAIGGKK